ncbi:hypothetical protein GVAV_001633 [Gurleya vavrai]
MIVNGNKNKEISRVTGVVRKTIYLMKKNSKKELRKMYYSEKIKIGGNGIICEADESKFGKRKNHRGHRVDGVGNRNYRKNNRTKNFIFIVKNKFKNNR